MNYTPGPWRWWETVSGARVAGRPADGSKNFVCDVLLPERAVNYEANARLIAAAPDLLEALQLVRDYVVTLKGNGHDYQIAIDAAIAKAQGETS